MHRRQFVTGALASAFLAACREASDSLGTPSSSSPTTAADDTVTRAKAVAGAPNILVILVDEMRVPPGFPSPSLAGFSAVIPNMVGLWKQSVCFANHFTATSDCSPARASLITGLYAQQHGLFVTRVGGDETEPDGGTTSGSPSLQTALPTYGTMLAGLGYDTQWFGKWHLSDLPSTCVGSPLGAYGFGGGTCPDPTGSAGQGFKKDAGIAEQFVDWLTTKENAVDSGKPWCTTVSFVNPHDVQWFWEGSSLITGTATVADGSTGSEAAPPTFGYDEAYFARFGGNPCANFENPFAANTPTPTSIPKPAFQQAYANFVMASWGAVSYEQGSLYAGPTPPAVIRPFSEWYTLLQLYEFVQGLVDQAVGTVLHALAASGYADDTIVIFTSDHGEYGGAHGMRGKGGGAYDEGMHVPLSVYDPTGTYSVAPRTMREGLTSSVDLAPLLVTLASGGSTAAWQAGASYGYLSARHDLSAMLTSPGAAGRPYILYSTDEYLYVDPASCPTHVTTYRTGAGKLSAYNYWSAGSTQIVPGGPGQQLEAYDLGADSGELNNDPTLPAVSGFALALLGPTSDGTGGLVDSELASTTGFSSAMLSARASAITEYYEFLAYEEAKEADGGSGITGL